MAHAYVPAWIERATRLLAPSAPTTTSTGRECRELSEV